LFIVQTHCVACHASKPTNNDFDNAPGGVMLETIDAIRKNGSRILNQVVLSKAMPLANKTRMTEMQRQQLGAWIRAGMPIDTE
jgi:uncharacterized membrane protein